MGLTINGVVGGNNPQTKGSQPQQFRMDASGGVATAKLHGDYYEAAARNTMFSGSNLTGVVTTVGFATTHTGLCLSNPIGSGVNLVLNKVKYAILVQQTTALVFGLQTGYSASTNVTQTTPMVVGGNFVGQPAGVGLLAAAATLPIAPTRLILLDSLLTGAITVGFNGGNVLDMQGSLIIPPGGFVATYTSAASVAASMLFGFAWEEVPVTL